MSIILETAKLLPNMEDYLFIDVRTKYGSFATGKNAFDTSHIKGALFLDVKADLTGETTFLPDAENLSIKLGMLGIGRDDKLVFYDQGNGRAAAKAWYVFKYLGHENVFILQGGFPAWLEANGPVDARDMGRKPTTYTVSLQQELIASITEVKGKLENDSAILIDSRAQERYRGDVEPKYKKAGHIPGAKNYQAKDVFADNGDWKTQVELQRNFHGVSPDEEVIVSCGTGNSACMNFVALKEAGFQDVKLFSGGFHEWIQDEGNDVATGEE